MQKIAGLPLAERDALRVPRFVGFPGAFDPLHHQEPPTMKLHSFALATLALLHASIALAADAVPPSPTSISGMFRVLKSDGSTVLSQAILTGGFMQQIGVKASDALVAANGRCAFNVKLEEIASASLPGTTTRLYSNDTLVANVIKLDLTAKTPKSYVTQPYFYAGRNNVKVMFNAESAAPSAVWVQVLVDGACTAAAPAAPAPAASKPEAKPPVVAAAPVKAGSTEWTPLFNAYGYSNYAVTGLKGKGFKRYDELASVNAALVAAVKTGTVERSAYTALMARWNAITNDADFKALMAKVVPGGDKRA
jgi:hypothetical protein